ncbi:MAG: hypothetical protein H6833_14210 [Planctomycetes bacterium]|nr:hypothetical protein [Planctomycetota bacterium]
MADEDGRTGLSPFDPPRALLSVVTADGYLWQRTDAVLTPLPSLDDEAVVKALWKGAAPAALVVNSPQAGLLEHVEALVAYRAALVRTALHRRYGKPVSEPTPPFLASLLDESKPPREIDLSAMLDLSRTLQIWRFAGGWGLHAILSGAVEVWRGRLADGSRVQQHADVQSIPVW